MVALFSTLGCLIFHCGDAGSGDYDGNDDDGEKQVTIAMTFAIKTIQTTSNDDGVRPYRAHGPCWAL